MMRDVISWAYNVDATNLQSFREIYFIPYSNSYFYLIPVGDEPRTVFFHLLKFIDQSPHFNHVFTTENAPTVEVKNKHYYAVMSNVPLHQPVTKRQLAVPVLYSQGYPLATHSKPRWLTKNQIHEQELSLALDKVPPHLRNTLFDIATYYIHLNEEAYRLIAPLEDIPYSTTLCHARVKPDTYLYELFMPALLILDNRSRIYCEYVRHLFLETGDLSEINDVVATAIAWGPLTETEWHLLYARLYFPSHFYDIVYDIIHNEEVNLEHLYEQTMHYAKLLAYLPRAVQQHTGVTLPVPDWVKREATLG